jgi:hypothetical protein
MTRRVLYHLMPSPMIGDTLYPLNRLKAVDRAAHDRHLQKYTGREGLLERPIPPLNCLWNDVLHLSPVHPALIRDATLKLGLPWPANGRQVGIVDPGQLGMAAENTVIFPNSDTRKVALRRATEPYLPFDPALLDDLARIPDRTILYLEEVKRTGQTAFLFVGIPHVLFRGTIELKDITVITV